MGYRKAIAANVRALMKAKGWKRHTIEAYYSVGIKAGERVSPRTIGHIRRGSEDRDAPGPSIDAVAAIAAAADLELWQLLVPGFDPNDPPKLALTAHERSLHEQLKKFRDALNGSPPVSP